jgi:hypothetical protein
LAQTSILLNYTNIVRYTNTENPTVQLEIINDDTPLSQFTWESSDIECATVSDDGLITCQSNVGWAYISVTDGKRNAYCTVEICQPDNYYNEEESDTITVVAWNDKEDKYVGVVTSEDEEGREIGKINNLSKYVYYSGDIEIPDQLSFNGRNFDITSISSSAFKWCSELETISIPYSVENVGGYYYVGGSQQHYNPFVYCDNLERINVDDESEFLKSVDGVLYSKDGKTLIAYPANRAGKSYTISKDVEEIYIGAFAGCKNLENIIVEDGNIHYMSIDGVLIDSRNQGLLAYPIGKTESEYSTPNGILFIYDNAFYNSSNLEVIDCNYDVADISQNAFFYCSNLNEVKGMEQIYRISKYMFEGCKNLKKVGGGSGTVEVNFDCDSNSDQIVELLQLKEMVNLREIEIHSSAISDFNELKNMHDLNSVRLYIDDDNVNLDVLCELENLQYLELYNVDTLTDLSVIEEIINKAKNLEAVHIISDGELPKMSWMDELDYDWGEVESYYNSLYMRKTE